MDGWTYVRMDRHTDSPCSTGLRLLRFPPEPLPCSHSCQHYKIPEHGKGTDDHLLPLGDWLFLFPPFHCFWAADPEGMMSCRTQGRNSIHLSVQPPVHPRESQPLDSLSLSQPGGKYGRMDVYMDVSPCVLQGIFLYWGHCPKGRKNQSPRGIRWSAIPLPCFVIFCC